MKAAQSDCASLRLPISIKGVISRGGRVCLLYNERGEWELPGGKLEEGESPAECLAREIEEELGIRVDVGDIVHAWPYHIRPGVEVFIVAYRCIWPAGTAPAVDKPPSDLVRVSDEHSAVGWFTPDELAGLNLPDGYRQAIARADCLPLTLRSSPMWP